MALTCDHIAICVGDLAVSTRFYTEGIGLEVFREEIFEGDWPTLFDAPGNKLHSVFLGDPARPFAGAIELVEIPEGVQEGAGHGAAPERGFFLISFHVDVDATMARLDALNLLRDARRVEKRKPDGTSVVIGAVRDPDGVKVELISR